MNAILIEENPEIDVFLNLKYNIDFKNENTASRSNS